jgi:hypothetical protein
MRLTRQNGVRFTQARCDDLGPRSSTHRLGNICHGSGFRRGLDRGIVPVSKVVNCVCVEVSTMLV